MAKFKVLVEKEYLIGVYVTVEADSENAALERATKLWKTDDDEANEFHEATVDTFTEIESAIDEVAGDMEFILNDAPNGIDLFNMATANKWDTRRLVMPAPEEQEAVAAN